MAASSRIAILEDSPLDGALIRHMLESAHYPTQWFTDGHALVAALSAGTSFSLLLLDWELPGISGLEVLRWTQKNLSRPPAAIFVTNHTREQDVVQGLTAGADDYLTKPVREAELIARVGVQLRRDKQAQESLESFTLGEFSVDPLREEIRLRQQKIPLTPKEYQLASLFLRYPGRLFSRDDLSVLVWNRELVSTSRTLDTHLSNIRKKLQIGPATRTQLSASYTLGYRLELLDV